MDGKSEFKLSAGFIIAVICVLLVLLGGCGGKRCEGPALDTDRLQRLKGATTGGSSSPRAFLVLPNPIDATRNNQISSTDRSVLDAASGLGLVDLLEASRLESSFAKVRIRSIQDDASTLARPNNKGEYSFNVSDVHYSEAMAYYAVTSMIEYVEALGFSVVKTRPLYIMVRAVMEGVDESEPNAIYDHNYLNPSSPRTMRLFGNSAFAPGMDAEMYRHEFGHLFNESVNGETGMDFAGDNGAIYTEGAALHECLADYLAESYGDKPTIGKWLARNIQGFRPGEPLRTAEDGSGKSLGFGEVGLLSSKNGPPERYKVAEWCTRVLWTIRQRFVDRDGENGALFSDRLVFSAASMLKKDTSISQFHNSLLKADDTLHCGENEEAITKAFEGRGFRATVAQLGQQLKLSARAVGLQVNKNGEISATSIKAGAGVSFDITITNTSGETARNVRLKFESQDSKLITTTYQQGYGDLPPGASVKIGKSGLPYDFSVHGEMDKSVSRGKRLGYRLRVLVENGDETTVEGDLSP